MACPLVFNWTASILSVRLALAWYLLELQRQTRLEIGRREVNGKCSFRDLVAGHGAFGLEGLVVVFSITYVESSVTTKTRLFSVVST